MQYLSKRDWIVILTFLIWVTVVAVAYHSGWGAYHGQDLDGSQEEFSKDRQGP